MISAPVFCPHFVSRQRELAFLVERRRDLARSRGGMILVGGDAGIGKSRLVREFLEVSGQSRGRVAIGRCRPFASAPYGPLKELLATLAPAAALVPAQTQDAQLAAFADAFISAAAKHAIVAIVEDLHWSDGGTLAVLALLAERLAGSRLLFVATYRANELGPQHPHYVALGALQRNPSVASIGLEPLGAAEVHDFIDAALRDAPRGISLQTRREVAVIAEGNPFFTEELLKSAVDRAQSHQSRRSLPTTVHAAILERVAPLSAGDRAILTHAAVIGRRFDPNLLAHTLDTDVSAILPALAQARALQILDETGAGETFRFRHALTREAVYDQLLIAQRRPLHRRIAQALEAQPAWHSSLDALAYHWWAAGDREKALTYGESGGDDAQALHAYADSIACYERALSLLVPHERDAARIRAKIGTSYFRSGSMDRAIEQYRQAWAYFRTTTDDGPYVFRLARNLAFALYNDGRLRDGVDFFREAVEIVARCGDRRATERASLTLASHLVEFGDIDGTRAALRAIDRDLMADDVGLTIVYWTTECRVCALEGDVGGVRGAAERVHAIGEHPADVGVLIDGLTDCGLCALLSGESALARRCLTRAIDTCVAVKSTALIHGDKLASSAFERCLSGAFEEARALIERALPMIGDMRITKYVALAVALAAGTALGDPDLLALRPDAAFIETAFATGVPLFFGPLAALCAQSDAPADDSAAARSLLRRAIDAAAAALPLQGSFPLAIVAASHGSRADADAIAAFCARSASGGPAPLAAARLAQAILHARFGDPAAAVAPAREAAAGFAAIGWQLYEALAHETAGDRETAAHIRERIGYRGLEPAPVRATEARIEGLLSPREAEVARLVAGGGTNRAVAATLNVSVKLVEKHLSSIYAKLGVASRSQLTAYVLNRDDERSGSAGFG